jgi:hypothetical protein
MNSRRGIRVALVGLGFGAEFVRSIVEGRRSRQDTVTTANWNVPGICAHLSAMQGGVRVEIPSFEE